MARLIDKTPARRGGVGTWQDFRDETRGGGALYTAHYLLIRCLPQRFFRFGSLHIVALELPDVAAPTEETSDIRIATPTDIDTLVAGRESQWDWIRQEVARGRDVWVVEQAGKLIAYDVCGVQARSFANIIKLEAPEKDIWGIKIWVAPEARGQGIGGQLRRRAGQEFRSRGYVRFLAAISVTNKRSMHAFEKIGAKLIQRLDFVWLCGFGVARFDGRLKAGFWTKRRPLTLALTDRASATATFRAAPAPRPLHR